MGAKSQAEIDRIRGEENTAYVAAKAELEKGITGIKLALKILNEYYASDAAHETPDGAASGIISLLEVVEADFSTNLAQITADEQAAAAAHETATKENEIDRTAKEQSVKYKGQESKSLDKTVAELTSDRNGVRQSWTQCRNTFPRSKRHALRRQRPMLLVPSAAQPRLLA